MIVTGDLDSQTIQTNLKVERRLKLKMADHYLGNNLDPSDMESILDDMAREFGYMPKEEDNTPEWKRVADRLENRLASETLDKIETLLKADRFPCETHGCNDHTLSCKVPATHTLKWVLRFIQDSHEHIYGEIREVRS